MLFQLRMEQICAVLDVQGFQFKDRFVPREVAIVSDFTSQCQELNPMMNWKDLSDEDQAVVVHSTKFKHGLHYCPFNPKEHSFVYESVRIGEIINIWYSMVSSAEKPLIAFKNPQLGKILKDLGIPCLDLDKVTFPSVSQLQDKYGDNYLCSYHKKPPRGSNIRLTCAYRKANQIMREIKEIESLEWMETN
jgi:hypothetical protein